MTSLDILEDEVKEKVVRDQKLRTIGQQIVHLNLAFERSLAISEEEGTSVTAVRMDAKIQKNNKRKQDLEAAWRRLNARKMTSPLSQQRINLLNTYLNKVASQL